MRRTCALLAGLALVAPSASVAATGSAQTPLQALGAGAGSDPAGWRFVGLPDKPAIGATQFEPGHVDGETGVRLRTRTSYGTWVHAWRGPAGTLSWRWRLDEPLGGGVRPADIRRKDGDDAALKVCVMFDHPLDRVPLGERTLLRLARTVSGEHLPAATVCYLWDPAQAAEASGANPYSRRVRYVVLQGQGAPLQRWVSERRDVAADFVRLFGDELPPGSDKGAVPPVSAVVIGADSDNTEARSSGWVGSLQWTGLK